MSKEVLQGNGCGKLKKGLCFAIVDPVGTLRPQCIVKHGSRAPCPIPEFEAGKITGVDASKRWRKLKFFWQK